ncbi:hypothetical protein [Pedobacter steynii]|uniref:Protochlamydia outer membrane protein domain-containing protein n=1 Tax=Pedobacter steynii TaxID=430522 RepID=A0A1D7QIV3_9SPHI|nr:hypothetical protein [Pedobacter steynii]AOM78606.1 hypothetical protein BFS30_16325 [Pedobacter steynii]
MKRHLITFFFALCCFSVVGQPVHEHKKRWLIAFYSGYTSENFQWSIAGNSNGQNPNVLSEVKWAKLKGPGMGLDMELDVWSHIFVRAGYHLSFIRSGTATDNDYAADNRSQPTYHALLKSNEGNTYRYSAALAYDFKLHKIWIMVPYVGYAISKQSLSLKSFEEEKGEQKLNSSYESRWAGPVIGVDLDVAVGRRISLNAGFNYKQLNYTGSANWNLIDAFKHPLSFRHRAKGFENQTLLRLNLKINALFSAHIKAEYSYAETGIGVDQLFLADGQERESRFNGAIRTVRALGAGIIFSPK